MLGYVLIGIFLVFRFFQITYHTHRHHHHVHDDDSFRQNKFIFTWNSNILIPSNLQFSLVDCKRDKSAFSLCLWVASKLYTLLQWHLSYIQQIIIWILCVYLCNCHVPMSHECGYSKRELNSYWIWWREMIFYMRGEGPSGSPLLTFHWKQAKIGIKIHKIPSEYFVCTFAGSFYRKLSLLNRPGRVKNNINMKSEKHYHQNKNTMSLNWIKITER